MTADCVFCKIVAGDIPAQVVYRDEHTCAFLDANPLVKGHTLVVPVRHHHRLETLDAQPAARHLGVLPRIVQAVQEVTHADGTTVAWNNGGAAGQEVPHLHAHVVPRFEDDTFGPIHTMFQTNDPVSKTETEQIAQRLQQALQ